MADFGKSLGNLALAATVSFAPMQSNAADVSKLPEAVIAKCKADTILALADFKAKIDAAAPTSTQEVTADRLARYERRFSVAVEGCLDVAVLTARSDQLTAQSNELTTRIDQLTARSDELDVGISELKKIDTALAQQLAFFTDFMDGKKSKAEYNVQIAALPKFVECITAKYAQVRKIYANSPSMLASIDRTEANINKVLAFALTANSQQPSGFKNTSCVKLICPPPVVPTENCGL